MEAMPIRSRLGESESPPLSEEGADLHSPEPQSEMYDTNYDPEDDEMAEPESVPSKPLRRKLFPVSQKRAPSSSTTTTKKHDYKTGYEADIERERRKAVHGAAYQRFHSAAHLRSLKRGDRKSRNRIWDEAIEKADRRIQEIEREREALWKKQEAMEEARKAYNERVGTGVGEPDEREDKEMEGRWKAFFELEVDEVEGHV